MSGGRASSWRLALPASTPEQRSRLEHVGDDASLVKKCSLQLDEHGHIDAIFFFTTAKPYAQGLPLWQVLEKVGVPGQWHAITRDEQALKAHMSAAYFTRPPVEPPKEKVVHGRAWRFSVDISVGGSVHAMSIYDALRAGGERHEVKKLALRSSGMTIEAFFGFDAQKSAAQVGGIVLVRGGCWERVQETQHEDRWKEVIDDPSFEVVKPLSGDWQSTARNQRDFDAFAREAQSTERHGNEHGGARRAHSAPSVSNNALQPDVSSSAAQPGALRLDLLPDVSMPNVPSASVAATDVAATTVATASVPPPPSAPPLDAPPPDAPAPDTPLLDAPLLDAPLLDAPLLDAPLLDAPPPSAPPPLCTCRPGSTCPLCRGCASMPPGLTRVRTCGTPGCTLRDGHGGLCSCVPPVSTDAHTHRAHRSLTKRARSVATTAVSAASDAVQAGAGDADVSAANSLVDPPRINAASNYGWRHCWITRRLLSEGFCAVPGPALDGELEAELASLTSADDGGHWRRIQNRLGEPLEESKRVARRLLPHEGAIKTSFVAEIAQLGLQTGMKDVARQHKHELTDGITAIRALKGCPEQFHHCDRATENSLREQDLSCVPLSIVWDIQGGTELLVGQQRVRLLPGEMLIFRGDLCHAGASYDTMHTRLHAYLDPVGYTRRGRDFLQFC
jgi:hypothetical protein